MRILHRRHSELGLKNPPQVPIGHADARGNGAQRVIRIAFGGSSTDPRDGVFDEARRGLCQ
ncbi:MAG TPA: hypothetical protein PK752_24860, partial [Accumulibacter sp.]|nr:hypothetical protein [Accumulibacter sp.]